MLNYNKVEITRVLWFALYYKLNKVDATKNNVFQKSKYVQSMVRSSWWLLPAFEALMLCNSMRHFH